MHYPMQQVMSSKIKLQTNDEGYQPYIHNTDLTLTTAIAHAVHLYNRYLNRSACSLAVPAALPSALAIPSKNP